jgi:hypothetical protein
MYSCIHPLIMPALDAGILFLAMAVSGTAMMRKEKWPI